MALTIHYTTADGSEKNDPLPDLQMFSEALLKRLFDSNTRRVWVDGLDSGKYKKSGQLDANSGDFSLDLRGCRVPVHLRISNTIFEHKVDLSEAHFECGLDFEDCSFQRGLDLRHARIYGRLHLEGCHIFFPLTLGNVDPDLSDNDVPDDNLPTLHDEYSKDAQLEPFVAPNENDCINWQHLWVEGALQARCMRVYAPINMARMSVGSVCRMEGSHFYARVFAPQLYVGGSLYLSSYLNTDSALYSLVVGSLRLRSSIIEGTIYLTGGIFKQGVNLRDVTVKGNVHAEMLCARADRKTLPKNYKQAKRTYFGESPKNSEINEESGDSLYLLGASIIGNINLAGAYLVGNLKLNGMTLGGYLNLQPYPEIHEETSRHCAIIDGNVIATRAKIGGTADFDRCQLKGYINFNDATIGSNFRFRLLETSKNVILQKNKETGCSLQMVRSKVSGAVSLNGITTEGPLDFSDATLGAIDLSVTEDQKTGDQYRQTSIGKASRYVVRVFHECERSIIMDNATVLGDVNISGAKLDGGVFISTALIRGRLFLDGAFKHDMKYDLRTQIGNQVCKEEFSLAVHDTNLQGGVSFNGGLFKCGVLFMNSIVGSSFRAVSGDEEPRTTFGSNMRIDGTIIAGTLNLRNANFQDGLRARHLEVGEWSSFARIDVTDDFDISCAHFKDRVKMDAATFNGQAIFDGMKVAGTLNLGGSGWADDRLAPLVVKCIPKHKGVSGRSASWRPVQRQGQCLRRPFFCGARGVNALPTAYAFGRHLKQTMRSQTRTLRLRNEVKNTITFKRSLLMRGIAVSDDLELFQILSESTVEEAEGISIDLQHATIGGSLHVGCKIQGDTAKRSYVITNAGRIRPGSVNTKGSFNAHGVTVTDNCIFVNIDAHCLNLDEANIGGSCEFYESHKSIDASTKGWTLVLTNATIKGALFPCHPLGAELSVPVVGSIDLSGADVREMHWVMKNCGVGIVKLVHAKVGIFHIRRDPEFFVDKRCSPYFIDDLQCETWQFVPFDSSASQHNTKLTPERISYVIFFLIAVLIKKGVQYVRDNSSECHRYPPIPFLSKSELQQVAETTGELQKTIENFKLHQRSARFDCDNRGFLQLLHQTNPYVENAYGNIERWLRNEGENNVADQVFLDCKEREEKKLGWGWREFSRKLRKRFIFVTIGYGLRPLPALAIWVLLTFSAGIFFYDPRSVEHPLTFIAGDAISKETPNSESIDLRTSDSKIKQGSNAKNQPGDGVLRSQGFWMALRTAVPFFPISALNDWQASNEIISESNEGKSRRRLAYASIIFAVLILLIRSLKVAVSVWEYFFTIAIVLGGPICLIYILRPIGFDELASILSCLSFVLVPLLILGMAGAMKNRSRQR